MKIPNDISIVIYLTGDWETYHRRSMIEAFSRNLLGIGRILSVNPVINPATAFLRGNRRRAIQSITNEGIQKISENLYVLHPHAPFYTPLDRFLDLSANVRTMLAKQIKKALDVIGASPSDKRISWLYKPQQVDHIGLIDETHVLYECYDEYCYTSLDYKPRPSVIEQEKLLLRQADIVFTTSRALHDSRSRLHSNVYLVPNGVDFEHFASALDVGDSPPQDILDIKKPIIGYIGSLGHSIDVNLLLDIIDNADWSFVLIGGIVDCVQKEYLDWIVPRLSRLKEHSNFYHLGWQERSQLPAYLKAIDVAVMPYIVNEHTKNSNHLKLWEYLATGRPVVAMNTSSEVWESREAVLVAQNRDEFISLIDYALKNDMKERIAKGIEMARQNSWDRITKNAVDIILQSVNSVETVLTA